MRMEAPDLNVARSAETVGIFVVTFRRPRLLAETLRSILAQTRAPDAVVVLNNDPDGDVRAVLAREVPGVSVVDLIDNTGSAGGFAAALRLAYEQGLTWAWLFDDDVLPYPDALQRLLAAYHADGGGPDPVGILAPLQVSPHATFGVSRWKDRALAIPGATAHGTQPYPVDVAYWAGMLVHRHAIEEVGYPRSDFFRCFADYEYCLRVRAAGLRIVAVPSSRVYHDHGSPTVVVRLGRPRLRFNYSPLRNYYHARNAAYTMRFILRSPLAMLYHALHEVRLSIGDLVYADRKAERVWLRRRGLMDGFRGRLGRLEDRR